MHFFQGGANAGHTIYDDAGNKYALHLVPSGILNKEALCLVGNGVVVHVPSFFEEVERLEAKGVQVIWMALDSRPSVQAHLAAPRPAV